MLRIELDRLLAYLVTGEDEELVPLALPLQRDALDLLASARRAIGVLSPGPVHDRVQERFDALEDAVLRAKRRRTRARRFKRSPTLFTGSAPDANAARYRRASEAPPSASARSAEEFGVSASFSSASSRESSGDYYSSHGPAMEPEAPAQSIARAVTAGERQVRRVAELELDKPDVRPVDDGGGEARLAVLERTLSYAAAARASLGHGYDTRGVGWSTRVDGVGHIGLEHEAGADFDRLLVKLHHENRAPDASRLVTWLPDAGPVIQAVTDAAGVAALPWPEPGSGTLRIDAARTVEIKIRVHA